MLGGVSIARMCLVRVVSFLNTLPCNKRTRTIPGDSSGPELDGVDAAVLEGGVQHALIGVPAACDGAGEAGDSTPEPPPCGEPRVFLLLIGDRNASLCFSAAHWRGVQDRTAELRFFYSVSSK